MPYSEQFSGRATPRRTPPSSPIWVTIPRYTPRYLVRLLVVRKLSSVHLQRMSDWLSREALVMVGPMRGKKYSEEQNLSDK